MKLIKQGAEAKIYEGVFCGTPIVVKERFPKKYRLREIDDELRNKRLTQEVRALQRCRRVGVPTPAVLHVEKDTCKLYLERIEGGTLRDTIKREMSNSGSYTKVEPLIDRVGEYLAKMHNSGIVHGDLTTSNIMLRDEDDKLFLIDFGLAIHSQSVEDKAVDMYVLERAFLSTHPSSEKLFEKLLSAYKQHAGAKQDTSKVLNKLNEVRMRGRKRVCFG